MGLSAGTRLGPYEITAPIGSGGMGEVYRARDTRLDRTVAVKILSSKLSDNAELKQRFEREARAISALQHPNICVLHDVGSERGTDYLVMEFLEGETLSNRLKRGALPIDEFWKVATDVADALDKAHRAGITHRDLKPGNIMLTKSGSKLLDFGLAKGSGAAFAATAGGSPRESVFAAAMTRTSPASPLTSAGSIVGTVQYMAPEQIEGKEADARSDIFSFGLVLYEMLTGARAFEGKTQASVVASILALDPKPLRSLKADVPEPLERVVAHCLEKDPDLRFQSAYDLKLQLELVSEFAVGTAESEAPATTRLGMVGWIAAAAAIVLAIVLGWLYYQTRVQPQYSTHSYLLPPDKSSYNFYGGSAGPVVISPDGQRIAFVASKPGATQFILWVQPLNSATAQAMSGTEGASYPFWSHNSRFVGFFADGKLKKVDANGGPPQALCDAGNGRGGTWNQDDVILFARTATEPLMRVSAAGGAPVNATELNAKTGERSHRWPQFLPDGKHFIFYVQNPQSAQDSGIAAGSLDSKAYKMLVRTDSSGDFAAGHLLFVQDGTLMAQRLDPRTLELEADATPIADPVTVNTSTNRSVFTVSTTGTLVYMGGGAANGSQLTWYDRAGLKQEPALGESAAYRVPALSPDGKRLAVGIQSGTSQDIWVVDLQRQTKIRITFGPAPCSNPVWSPDGKWIYYSSNRSRNGIYRRASDGTGGEETVLATEGIYITTTSISSDGKYLAFERIDPKSATKADAYALPLFGDRTPMPLVNTSANEVLPRFSPDGKWVAYMSDETGRYELYIKPFPGTGKYQVSTTGGFVGYWRGDGRELFYMSRGSLYAVDVQEKGKALELGTPHLLAKLATVDGPGGPFVPAEDGKRFLVNALGEEKGIQTLTLVNNWTADLKK
jgi:serine/threonine protein kinase